MKTANGSAPADAVATVSYTHAGGIDRPLVITKNGVSVLPHQNWRGQFSRGTWVDGNASDCPNSWATNCVNIPWPGWRTTAWHAEVKERDIRAWWGGLVDGMRDASGQMYMRNRYYDPATGQFTQQDPIGLAGGLNSYGFAAGDPVSYSDPYGLCPPIICGAAAGALIGGGIKMANNYLDDRPLTEDVGKWALGGAAVGATLGLGATVAEAALLRMTAGRAVSSGAAAGVGAAGTGRVMLEAAKQGKHIPGHNNFIAGRSLFTHADPQGLLDRFAGTGQVVAGVAGQPGFRERVNFGQVIGQINVSGGLTNTTKGIIHYSKSGAHILPANP
ncbi:MAG TPA: polymorphic toxin type 50 domain-containing protein [Longimicrobium sp.]|nr:polymorphic toxin type 50 domain-containing protein [Longimicrobium sp.]